jgi:hypothetical protein
VSHRFRSLFLIALRLHCSHGIRVSHRTFAELGTTASISPSRALLVTPTSPNLNKNSRRNLRRVCAEYSQVDYASPSDYTTCALLEQTRAAQCPSLALQPAGGKKVLTCPGVLEHFLAPTEGADSVRDWVRLWAFDESADEAVRH